ncbi:hypothetical protein ILUMI_25102 [Ignelater luminosus]|uniref:Uncharacterized protein n=1 Tax=Ignelater luminosus TaxID=2038154 RepID=A0A8K0C966_IGNLU|nr:hypothetical protein ILUMI_25102 [Ignelater luminosus]
MEDQALRTEKCLHDSKVERYIRGSTLQEDLDMMCIDAVDESFTEPSEVSKLTNEDSGDGGMLDNLSGRQLVAKVEIKLGNSERITPYQGDTKEKGKDQETHKMKAEQGK